MPDLDFRAFDRDTVAAAVDQPPLRDLRRRAAARRRWRPRLTRRRGTALTALLVMVAVPAAATGIALVPAGPSAVEAPADALVSQLVSLDAGQSAVGVLTTDTVCTPRFTSTTDGGHTWTPLRGPDVDCPSAPDVRHLVLGPRTYLVSVAGSRLDGWSYLTTDAGLTWAPATSAIVEVDAFPATATPVPCGAGCLSMPEPLAVDPGTGAAYRLRGSASLEYPVDKMYVAADGAMWAYLWGGGKVLSSVDRGATWRPAAVPAGTVPVAIAARDGREAYLSAAGKKLLHTTDAGATWAEVATDLPGVDGQRALAVTRDGAVLVGDDDGKVWISTDGGRRFTAGTNASGDGLAGSASGLLWNVDQASASAQVTEDGRQWATLALPVGVPPTP
jgi:photosystem II stability/assembly factor-like uncharacterized protein